MLEWCSISVSTMRSPAPTLASPQARATRLIASVALRTKMTSRRSRGADVVGDRRPRPLVGGGRLGRERVRAAVDVGVVAALVAVDRLDRGQHPLGAGAAVEVGDRLAADLALSAGKDGADLLDRERRRCGLLWSPAPSLIGQAPQAPAATSSRIQP